MVSSGIPFYDLVEIVFETISDGNDLFADINFVADDRIDMGEGNDKLNVAEKPNDHNDYKATAPR